MRMTQIESIFHGMNALAIIIDGFVKSQEFVIFIISHLIISLGYESEFLKF